MILCIAQQAWFLRLLMNACSAAVLVMFVVIAGAYVPPIEQRPTVHEPSITEVSIFAYKNASVYITVNTPGICFNVK